MILLFTDFGTDGPYVGQMKSVLHIGAPTVPVVDLMHDAPPYDAESSAYLLAALTTSFPIGAVFLSVVDPGVGTERKAIVVKADGRWFVGPDNGLFAIITRRAGQVRAWEISWRPECLSTSFHGRDLFAPVAAAIAATDEFDANRFGHDLPIEAVDRPHWPDELAKIIYIDRFGNGVSGLLGENVSPNDAILVHNVDIKGETTFGSVPAGTVFWYVNSSGLVEIACNRGRASTRLGFEVGTVIKLAENQPVTAVT